MAQSQVSQRNRLANLKDALPILDGVQERADPLVRPHVSLTIDEMLEQIDQLEQEVGDE